MTAALEVRDVSREYGSGRTCVAALSEVSLTVQPGELVAIMGPSGSGKSTLLGIAGGLDRATGGQVLVDAHDLGELDGKTLAELRRRFIGYVFQELNLLATLTAEENVALPLELDGARPRKAAAQARSLLGELGLAELAGRFPEERTAAASAGLLALLGGLLAVPAGLLPLAAIYAASPAAAPLVIPWIGLGTVTILVPLLAAAGAATLTRTRLGARGLRASQV